MKKLLHWLFKPLRIACMSMYDQNRMVHIYSFWFAGRCFSIRELTDEEIMRKRFPFWFKVAKFIF